MEKRLTYAYLRRLKLSLSKPRERMIFASTEKVLWTGRTTEIGDTLATLRSSPGFIVKSQVGRVLISDELSRLLLER